MSLKLAGKSIISTVVAIYRAVIFRVSTIYSNFDIKPIFFLGGLAITGYGMYLRFSLGTALIFVGIILMLLGYLMNGRRP